MQKDLCKVADVSVIIPFYSNKNELMRAVDSILFQSVKPKEIIIVVDNPSEKVSESDFNDIKKFNIELLIIRNKENLGAGHSRNIGVLKASGYYIAFLDSDDVWNKNKIEIQEKYMRENNISFSAHKYMFNDDFSDSKNTFDVKELNIICILLANRIYTPTVMVKKTDFVNFDITLRRCDDINCWVKNIKVSKGYILNLYLARGFKNPIGQAGLTQSKILMHIAHNDSMKKLYDENIISFFEFSLSLTFEYLKYHLIRKWK